MEYYQPIMIMVLIQFIYSGMTLGTRIGLLEGMSPRVFVVYRHAFATIFIALIAYLSGYLFTSFFIIFILVECIQVFLNFAFVTITFLSNY
jgi:small basic protein